MISMYSRQYKIGKIIINVNVELCFYLEIGRSGRENLFEYKIDDIYISTENIV